MRRTTRIQKFLSLLLAFCMVLVLLPATAFAVSDTKPEDDWTQQIEDRIDIHETENDALSFDETDVIEFIDFEHSPKNLMLRARYTGKRRPGGRERAEKLRETYGFAQTLLDLTEKS